MSSAYGQAGRTRSGFRYGRPSQRAASPGSSWGTTPAAGGIGRMHNGEEGRPGQALGPLVACMYGLFSATGTSGSRCHLSETLFALLAGPLRRRAEQASRAGWLIRADLRRLSACSCLACTAQRQWQRRAPPSPQRQQWPWLGHDPYEVFSAASYLNVSVTFKLPPPR